MRLNYVITSLLLSGLVAGCASRVEGPNDTKPTDLAQLPADSTNAVLEKEVIQEGGMLLDAEVLPKADRQTFQVSRIPIGKMDIEPVGLPKSRPSQPKTFPVTIRFSETRLESALQVFAKAAGYNLVVDGVDGLKGNPPDVPPRTVDLFVDGVPWIEAYDLLQQVASLETVFDDNLNLMSVYDRGGLATLEQQLIDEALQQVNRVETFRRLSTRRADEPKVIERFMLRHVQPEEAQIELRSRIEDLYGDSDTPQEFKPSIAFDLDPASLILRGTKRQLDEAAMLLSQIDILPRQVVIEAFFVEVGDEFEQEFGARLDGATSNDGRFVLGTGNAPNAVSGEAFDFLPISPENGTPISGITLIDNLSAGRLRLELAALQEDKLSRTVSAPKILTRSGETGKIERKETKYYLETSQTTEGDNPTTVASEAVPSEAPLSLEIKPTVVGDYIHMEISLKNTTFEPVGLSTNLPPNKNEVSIESGKMILKAGEVVVIGGVTSQSAGDDQVGVPGLSQTPGLGRLFRNDAERNTLNQLLIFIAPRVI